MQTNQLPEFIQSSCNKAFMFSMVITLTTIFLYLKQYKKFTFEMTVLIINCLCLIFIMCVTGCAKVRDIFVALTLSVTPCLIVLWNFNPRNQRLKRLRNREDLSMDAIYSRFLMRPICQKNWFWTCGMKLQPFCMFHLGKYGHRIALTKNLLLVEYGCG